MYGDTDGDQPQPPQWTYKGDKTPLDAVKDLYVPALGAPQKNNLRKLYPKHNYVNKKYRKVIYNITKIL